MPRKRKIIDKPTSPKGKAAKSMKEDDTFPLLTLPTEILFPIFCHLDYATRRALRVNGRLAQIEKQTKYRCNSLKVKDSEEGVRIVFDNAEVRIPHSEVTKEFELMRENTTFDKVMYKQIDGSVDRRTLDEMCLIKAKEMLICSSILNDRDLESIVNNSEEVIVHKSDVTGDGLVHIYEQMRDGQFGKNVKIYAKDANHLWSIMEKFGTFDRDTLQFTATNPDQLVANIYCRTHGRSVYVSEDNQRVVFNGIDLNSETKTVELY